MGLVAMGVARVVEKTKDATAVFSFFAKIGEVRQVHVAGMLDNQGSVLLQEPVGEHQIRDLFEFGRFHVIGRVGKDNIHLGHRFFQIIEDVVF